MNFAPSKHRPTGVTILGIWAIAGGLAAFGTIFNRITEYRFDPYGILNYVNAINTPLGGTYAFIELYASLVFAVGLMAIGILTLYTQNKGIWAANVGISMLALSSLAFITNYIFYVLGDPNQGMSIAGLDNYFSKLIMVIAHYGAITASAVRLYYLLKRNTRQFFSKAQQQPFLSEA